LKKLAQAALDEGLRLRSLTRIFSPENPRLRNSASPNGRRTRAFDRGGIDRIVAERMQQLAPDWAQESAAGGAVYFAGVGCKS